MQGGTEVGEDKAVRRETPRKRSERIEVILSKRDMSRFCWVAKREPSEKQNVPRLLSGSALRLPPLPPPTHLPSPSLPFRKSCCVQVACVPLPCVCVSGSPFRGLLCKRRSTFLPPGLPTPPPDPTEPSEGAWDLLLRHNENN